MAARKSERLMNLTIALLTTRGFLSRERVRGMVEGYAGLSEDAFQRMFERDKAELRELGLPVETGSLDAWFDDDPGYRIRRGDFELPPVRLDADEVAVLVAAAQVWQQAGVAASTRHALAKLRADGDVPDTARLAVPVPRLTAREPAFPALWEATQRRQAVRFRYRSSDEERRLEPWVLVARRGAWYVVGRDVGRDAERMFKLSRVTGLPVPVGAPGAYQVPDGLDVDALVARLAPPTPGATALVAVKGDRAPTLRRRAQLGGTVVEGAPDGFCGYLVPYAGEADLVGEVAAAAPDALVLEPPGLADALRAHLAGLVANLEGEGHGDVE